MRVLVCGGRDYSNAKRMAEVLGGWFAEGRLSVIIHGEAPGADSLAAEWASECGVVTAAFPADWDRHGRAAGPIRNQRMIDEGKPDVVIAFPGGRGTADMVKRAKAAGVMVITVSSP